MAKEDAFFPLLRQAGIRVYNSHTAEDALGIVAQWRYIRSLWTLLARERPALLHSVSPKAIILSTIVARLQGVRVVVTLTGLGYVYTLPAFHPLRIVTSLLYRIVLPWAHEVIFLNSDDLRHFCRWRMARRHKMTLIRSSGVDVQHFARHGRPYPQVATFIFVGRLLLSKGIAYLLRAAALLASENLPYRLLIVGSHTYGSQRVIEQSALRNYERILGKRLQIIGETLDVRRYLWDSSVCVLPTYYREGVPQSILEAMAAGLAIITTTMPGSRETVVDSKNGFLIPPRTTQSLVDAMRACIVDPQRAITMGLESYALVRRRFSVTMVNQSTIESYRRVGVAIPVAQRNL